MSTTTEVTTKEYRVYSCRLETLIAQVASLNKRAFKLGVSAIVLTDTGRFEDVNIYRPHPMEHEVLRVDRYVFVVVTGTAPKFAGWTLAAVVEHTEEGNLLRKSPDCTVELGQFRAGAPRCDHCNTIRNRRDTYICLHESGALKMIGANCIKDFLGHKDPHFMARLAELSFSLAECCEASEEGFEGGYGLRDTRVHVPTTLSYAACVIRHKGFVSGKTARETREAGGDLDATSARVRSWMNPPNRWVLNKDYFQPEDCDCERAEVARQYVLDTLGNQDAEKLSDFEHNLLLACRCESVEQRNVGLLAFVPEYYSRAVEQRQKAAHAAANSAHFGEVKKRYKNVTLTYIKSHGYTSQFGDGFYHKLATETGASLTWKTCTPLSYNTGQQFLATFTIKAHSEFRGEKQTDISRLVEETPAPVAVAA